jgi:membrane protein DedA with SNARE-associated domain
MVGWPAVFEALEHFMTEVIGDYGYYAVIVLMILESACIPIPSEVTMVFGGFLVSRGRLDFFWVGMLGTLANVLGSWLAYWVGLVGGRPLIERWGRYIFLRPHELDRAEVWFEKHGEAAVFVSRLLPVVRTFISLPAGVAKMPFVKFTVYTFLGCLPWTFALTWAGFLLGENWETFLKYGEPVSIAIGVVLLGLFVWWLIKRARAKRRALIDGGEGHGTTAAEPPDTRDRSEANR